MHQLIQDMARERERDVERGLRHKQFDRAPATEAPDTIVIRLARACDAVALRRLAALEGRELTPGSWLFAETDGVVGAALNLDAGTLLADPFQRSAPLGRVLELWAQQLTGRRVRRRRLLFG